MLINHHSWASNSKCSNGFLNEYLLDNQVPNLARNFILNLQRQNLVFWHYQLSIILLDVWREVPKITNIKYEKYKMIHTKSPQFNIAHFLCKLWLGYPEHFSQYSWVSTTLAKLLPSKQLSFLSESCVKSHQHGFTPLVSFCCTFSLKVCVCVRKRMGLGGKA